MELRPNLLAQTKQSLTITPGLIQSIQILKFGQEDLQAYLREQEERNPLIEVVAPRTGPVPTAPAASATPQERPVARDPGASARSGIGAREPLRSIEETCADMASLREKLLCQAQMTFKDTVSQTIAVEIVEAIEPDGYLRRDLDEIAELLGVDEGRVEAVLHHVQGFEPVGVGARNLAECLRLQLAETGRLTPAFSRLMERLDLLASSKIEELARHCAVTPAEVMKMAAVIRTLDPRPGRQYDHTPMQAALPDLTAEFRPDGTIHIELNSDLLPKVLVNREYYSEMRKGVSGTEETRFVTDCMRNATWLTRNLDQRANTILKVATEIVKRQRDFFLHGVEHIKPLCQGDVAEAVGMHRSTICRATAGKYIQTNRGLFELGFFFSNSLGGEDGEGDHSAESIRAKIRNMIEAETAATVLSDDAIMNTLRRNGVDIARRTVAKYREMMGLPSSQVRKRQKRAILHNREAELA